MNKIAIVGCGWLGLPLAKAFLKNGFLVNGSTTTKEKISILEENGIRPFLFSLPTSSKELIDCLNVDIVIINIPPGRKDPNVAIHFPEKVHSILTNIPNHTKILFISSTSVYGDLQGVVNEKTIPKPSTASGQALYHIEQKLLNQSNSVERDWSKRSSILRLSGLVGGSRIQGRFFAGKKNIPLGEAPVNLIHRDDCIRIIIGLIEGEKWGELYNLSCDFHPDKRTFYIKACIDAGLDVPSFLAEGKKRKIINSDKIKSDLGIKLLHPNPMEFSF